MTGLASTIAALQAVLSDCGRMAVAVSGGVDSLTLASFAQRYYPAQVSMYHAVSPAVPLEASQRVRELAAREGWRLEIVDAGEFTDPDYLANPVNRCFYCKSSLYGTLARHSDARLLSGTNLDDLGEYRPGLQAAEAFGVRHPYVEALIDKQTLRRLSTWLGLGEVATLPASPCLASRIETAIVIDPELLELVHAIERLVGSRVEASTVRCRVRSTGLVIELDEHSHQSLGEAARDTLLAEVRSLVAAAGRGDRLDIAPYRRGGAFIHTPPPAPAPVREGPAI
ncbi:MAG: hypothetical protein ACK5HY_10925 [Parahaliea sp.]